MGEADRAGGLAVSTFYEMLFHRSRVIAPSIAVASKISEKH